MWTTRCFAGCIHNIFQMWLPFTALQHFKNYIQCFLFVFIQSGYGNASPYMVATEASLTALNETLPKPMSMKRFRPNIVISGTEAWAEVRAVYDQTNTSDFMPCPIRQGTLPYSISSGTSPYGKYYTGVLPPPPPPPLLTFSLPRVNNFKFLLQSHQKYYNTQYEEVGFS